MTNFDDMLQVLATNGDPLKLDELKRFFQEDISSPRLFARINSYEDLLNVCLKRGTFDETNVEALEVIADYLKDNTICNAIDQYVPLPADVNMINQYAIETEKDEDMIQRRLQSIHISSNENHQMSNHSPIIVPSQNINASYNNANFVNDYEKKRNLIRRLVCRNIGHKSREFGAALGISQGEMDRLDILYPHSIESRITGMFTVLEEEELIDASQWTNVVCQALIDCRRSDLDRKIREILARK